MRDYDAIKEALTFYAATAETTRKTRALLDAADAIEELIKTSRRWELEAAANEKDKQYLVDENRRLVDSLMNLLVQKWISVEERLPNYLDHVLCVNKHGIQMVGHLTDYKEGGFRCETGMDRCDYITHWMPLPDQPKEDKL